MRRLLKSALRFLLQAGPTKPDTTRSLIIALHQGGWNGLITNNYKMLDVPAEVAAIVKTKLTVVAVEGLGHDPLRAVGALLLELPGIANRIRPNRPTCSA